MSDIFDDILGLNDVQGIVIFSRDAELIFKDFRSTPPVGFEDKEQWAPIIESLSDLKEADLAFENGRIYFRDTGSGSLFIICGPLTPMAMLRLNCDLLIPALKTTSKKKGKGAIPDVIRKKIDRNR